MALRSTSSVASATATSVAVPVPSGAAVGDIVVVNVYLETADTITAPSGFTLKQNVVLGGSETTAGRNSIYWKRLTAADTGTYTFSWTSSVKCEAVATAHSGRINFGDPFEGTIGVTQSGASSTTIAATGPTTSYDDCDLIAIASCFTAVSWTPPASFTERYDPAPGNLTLATQDGVSAGAVGSKSFTLSSAQTGRKIWVGALAPGGAVRRREVTTGAPGSTASFTPTLPDHDVDTLLTLVVTGKYNTASVPTINQGWTLVGSSTGGTGAAAVDAGTMFAAVYQKVATSASETAPTVTAGGTAPNTWSWLCASASAATGKTWRDTIGASAPQVVFASDTSTASPLVGPLGTFTGVQPTTGDYLLVVGGIPTNSGSQVTVASTSLSATGLSGGVQSIVNTNIRANALGDDMEFGWIDWQAFTGTETGDLSPSFVFTSATDHSGILVGVAVRQAAAGVSSSATISETATLTTAGEVGKAIGATLAAVAAITAAGVVGTSSGAAISETATITAAGDALAANEGTATIAETATVTAVGEVGADTGASLDATGTVTAAGAVGFSGSASLDATGILTAAGAKGYGGTASITAAATLTAAGEVSEPGSAGASITATVTLTATGVVVSFDTDTSNDDDGIYLGDGYAEVVWDPAIVAVPATLALGEYRTVATVIDTAPAAHNPAVKRTLSIPAAIDRVLIDNVDFTFYGGAAAIVEGIKLIDPLLYGNATVTLPAINPQFPSDLGDLYDYFRFARVRIQRVLDGSVVATDHKGFVSRIDTSGTELRLEIGGQAAGALSQLYVPPPVYRRKQDVEHILVDTLRDARVQAKEHAGDSGLGLIRRGGSDGLSIFNETLAVWAGSTGQAITFTPNAHGVYRKTQKPDAEDPADFTCYPSDLVQIDLSQDFMEQYTRVYAQGYTAAGQLVANIKTPGLTQGEAPELDATLLPGDESDQVALLQEQLAIHDYLDLDDVTSGVFDDETVQAVLAFKYDSEDLVSLTPEVGVPAWEALWNLSEIGYSVDDAREYPTAADPSVAKWLRTANGSKLRENPNYDPHLIPNDVFIDVGGPFGKGVVRDYARSKLVAEGGVWSGTITLRSGVVDGVHNPGDPFTTADIMDRRDVLPNMKAWLPHFAGGITVYVSGVEHAGDTTSLLVSSVPQTTMEVWQALERRKEAKSNPGRAWSGHTRRSQVRNDNGPQWDTSSGLIANNVDLVAGWNEVKVPAGQAGIVQRLLTVLEDPAEYAMLLTQKPVSVDALNSNIPTPLTDNRPVLRPWWEKDEIESWLQERGYLDAWGTPKQPCGYDPTLKTDDFGDTGQNPSGRTKETCGFNYETGVEPVLYLYIWVEVPNVLLRGRVLRNQRTTDI